MNVRYALITLTIRGCIMSDKYNSMTKPLAEESTYQMLVEGRNQKCKQEGATEYTVVDSKLVEDNGIIRDCPLFFDSTEFYNLNDPSKDDTWGGQTTTAIYTIDTLATPSSKEKIQNKNKELNQLNETIKKVVPVVFEDKTWTTNLFDTESETQARFNVKISEFNGTSDQRTSLETSLGSGVIAYTIESKVLELTIDSDSLDLNSLSDQDLVPTALTLDVKDKLNSDTKIGSLELTIVDGNGESITSTITVSDNLTLELSLVED